MSRYVSTSLDTASSVSTSSVKRFSPSFLLRYTVVNWKYRVRTFQIAYTHSIRFERHVRLVRVKSLPDEFPQGIVSCTSSKTPI